MSHPGKHISSVGIIGGGVIGLTIAHWLLKNGCSVSLFESGKIGDGASHAAAGMLLPTSEISFENLDMYALSCESLRIWENYHHELREESGIDVDFRDGGSIMLAHDRDSAASLRRLHQFQKENDFDSEWMSGAALREKEVLISPRAIGGIFCPGDRQVDPRKVCQALRKASLKRGLNVEEHQAITLLENEGGQRILETASGQRHEFDVLVIACGVGSNTLKTKAELPFIRPVKGQVLEMEMTEELRVNSVVEGDGAYLVPKAGNRLLLGATTEEIGFDGGMTAGAVYRLLESARDMVPAIEELKLVDMWYGFRPAAPDNKPVVGWTSEEGIFFAGGHYRNGVLLAPITGRETAKMIMENQQSSWFVGFGLERFNRDQKSEV